MKNFTKRLIFLILIFFLSIPPALATSEYVDSWIGTWTVKMKDLSVETWEITDTWVSETGKSHMAYGIKNPGNVEFQFYFGKMFMKHYYIEASHDKTVYDLPMDLSLYTELLPADDFQSFKANPGEYPIRSGYKGTVEPKPCAASYLLGADDPRLDIMRQFRDTELSASPAGKNLIRLYYDKSADIITVCENNPAAKQSLKQLLEAITPAVSARCKKSAHN